MPRFCRCRASAASSRNRESGRTACSGWWSRHRAAPSRPRRCPCRFRSAAFCRLHAFQIAVRPGVMADGVARGRDPAHQRRMFGGGLADQEEGGAHAFMGQRRQHFGVGCRPWPVVEGQHHLAILQRQRLRKTLQADPRGGRRIDGENARGAERVLARTSARAAAAARHARQAGRAPCASRTSGPSARSHISHCTRCCPLGNACSDNSDEFSIPVKPARRGMAEDTDVAQPAEASCSTATRCGMMKGQIRQNLSRRSPVPSTRRGRRIPARYRRGTARGRSRRPDRGA